MPDFVFNVAKGDVAANVKRVNANDPTNAVFYVHAWVSTAADDTIKDLDDVSLVVADVNTAEATNSGYAQKQLDQAGGMTTTIDDGNNRKEAFAPDQTWTAVASGDNWTDVSFDYDSDSATGTDVDSSVVPQTWHDFVVNPDGSDITMDVPTTGFFWATD